MEALSTRVLSTRDRAGLAYIDDRDSGGDVYVDADLHDADETYGRLADSQDWQLLAGTPGRVGVVYRSREGGPFLRLVVERHGDVPLFEIYPE